MNLVGLHWMTKNQTLAQRNWINHTKTSRCKHQLVFVRLNCIEGLSFCENRRYIWKIHSNWIAPFFFQSQNLHWPHVQKVQCMHSIFVHFLCQRPNSHVFQHGSAKINDQEFASTSRKCFQINTYEIAQSAAKSGCTLHSIWQIQSCANVTLSAENTAQILKTASKNTIHLIEYTFECVKMCDGNSVYIPRCTQWSWAKNVSTAVEWLKLPRDKRTMTLAMWECSSIILCLRK